MELHHLYRKSRLKIQSTLSYDAKSGFETPCMNRIFDGYNKNHELNTKRLKNRMLSHQHKLKMDHKIIIPKDTCNCNIYIVQEQLEKVLCIGSQHALGEIKAILGNRWLESSGTHRHKQEYKKIFLSYFMNMSTAKLAAPGYVQQKFKKLAALKCYDISKTSKDIGKIFPANRVQTDPVMKKMAKLLKKGILMCNLEEH